MKIALTVWEERVSPVFDTARTLLVIDVEKGREVSRSTEPLGDEIFSHRVDRLKKLGINVLLCGAISRPLSSMIAASGIEVVPFITGAVDEVLAEFLNQGLTDPSFLMPGCYHRGRRAKHRRQFRGPRRG
ncbi:MAG: NifB/NifX family molybdenum-iron cluster-binding protein [Gemmatimonadota bacterium]|nr:NifB/NifX family molybdenum-iron cluster-binding protein [Gemmatimonadota bacterium]